MRAALAGLVAAACLVAACSSDGDGAHNASTTAPVTAFGGSTAPTGPAVSTTTTPGQKLSGAEAYAAAGLTPAQGACVAASGIDDEITVTPTGSGVELESRGRKVVVPHDVTTGAALERLLLARFASQCAPAGVLDELARSDGAGEDQAALADDLPARLLQRRADGATPAELDCIERAFRAAPALLSSLAADPRRVEAGCVPAPRLHAWWLAAMRRGLTQAGANPDDIDCLVGSAVSIAALGDVVDEMDAGGAVRAPDDPGDCLDVAHLFQLALNVVAKQADFGAETLGAEPS